MKLPAVTSRSPSANPLSTGSIRPTAGHTTALYGRDAFVDGAPGLGVVAGELPWTSGGILLLEAPETAGRSI